MIIKTDIVDVSVIRQKITNKIPGKGFLFVSILSHAINYKDYFKVLKVCGKLDNRLNI